MKKTVCVFQAALLTTGFLAVAGCHHKDQTSKDKPSAPPVPVVEKPKGDPIDLVAIRHVAPKGRFQDAYYNPDLQPAIDRLVARGPEGIDFLISKISDNRKTKTQVFDFWPVVRVGDVAFLLFCYLFTDASWEHSTVPGISLEAFVEDKDQDQPWFNNYYAHLEKYGRKSLQKKCAEAWAKYRDNVVWDAKDRCFKLKNK
jgi:hypothetical protein